MRVYLLTDCATSKMEHEPQRRRANKRRARRLYERLRRVVGYCLAHKAWWHNKRTILIYASADFPSSSDVGLKRESTMFEK